MKCSSLMKKPGVRLRYLAREVKSNLKPHLVASTAMLAEASPIFSAVELKLADIAKETSLNNRAVCLGVTYLGGMGWLYERGRSFSRKMFDITAKTREGVQFVHDSLYTGLFTMAASPIIYTVAGERDVKKIAVGAVCAGAAGILNGPLMGYAVDAFLDLTGIKECERPSYPDLLKRRHPVVKKTLATLATAASVAATAAIYASN